MVGLSNSTPPNDQVVVSALGARVDGATARQRATPSAGLEASERHCRSIINASTRTKPRASV
eukprot:9154821-Alexandrium_andersonii.AAC.1